MNLAVKKERPMCYSQHNALYHIIKRYFDEIVGVLYMDKIEGIK